MSSRRVQSEKNLPELSLIHPPLDQILEALYVINKTAKQKKDRWKREQGAASKRAKIRRDALYQLKYDILTRIPDEQCRIELHKINENEFYCYYYDSRAFHAPVSAVPTPNSISAIRELRDFCPSITAHQSNIETTDALQFLRFHLGMNINDYIQQQSVRTVCGDCLDVTFDIETSEYCNN
jgi:hypothetical protein